MPTAPRAPEHVISLSLFDSIDEYAALLESGNAFVRKVVPETSPVVSFCENAFAQFFQNVVEVEITGFDEKDQKRCARLRRAKRDLPQQMRALMALFEQFCEVIEDVLGAGYGGQATVLEEFHTVYVLRLLDRIIDLGQLLEDEELTGRAEDAYGTFEYAASNYDWDPEDDDD